MADELIVDLTNATTELYPDLPPWAELEANDFYELFSAGSIDKARQLIKDKRVEEFKEDWWTVRGSEAYTVQIIPNPYNGVPWTTCTCPNGQNRSSRPTCYHSAAVLMRVLNLIEEQAGDTGLQENQGEENG